MKMNKNRETEKSVRNNWIKLRLHRGCKCFFPLTFVKKLRIFMYLCVSNAGFDDIALATTLGIWIPLIFLKPKMPCIIISLKNTKKISFMAKLITMFVSPCKTVYCTFKIYYFARSLYASPISQWDLAHLTMVWMTFALVVYGSENNQTEYMSTKS